ncbi:MAG: hypothetical protein JW807_13155 [Spirochaetes bacterium]|nr:hypothetical protein [Spirochaetota bacterium]
MRGSASLSLMLTLISFILVAIPIKAVAEVIYLHDGSILKGKVVKANSAEITINSNNNIIKLRKSAVKAIKMDDDPDNEILNAEFEPYSVGAAVWMSVFPVWSGSFRIGYNPYGLTFVLFKTPTFIASYVFMFLDVHEISRDKGIFHDKYDNTWRIACFSSIGVWFLLTIGDMIFSGRWIKKYNDAHMSGLMHFKQNISLDFSMSQEIEDKKICIPGNDRYYAYVKLRY